MTGSCIKVVCSRSDHLKAGPPLDGKIFSLNFRERNIDVACNRSGFVIFQAGLNYL